MSFLVGDSRAEELRTGALAQKRFKNLYDSENLGMKVIHLGPMTNISPKGYVPVTSEHIKIRAWSDMC